MSKKYEGPAIKDIGGIKLIEIDSTASSLADAWVQKLSLASGVTEEELRDSTKYSAKTIKDMSAAAVLIVVIISIIVGILIFLPHFLKLLG